MTKLSWHMELARDRTYVTSKFAAMDMEGLVCSPSTTAFFVHHSSIGSVYMETC